MVHDMARANFDPEAQYAALGERVEGHGRRLTNLEGAVNKGFKDIETSISTLGVEFRNSQRPQWQAISVALTFAGMVGALAYWPLRENQNEMKVDIRDSQTSSLSVAAFVDFKNTYENNRIVSRTEYLDKFNHINDRIKTLDDNMVPRQEHERVWQSYDKQIENLQAQVNDLKQQAGSVYNQRDLMRDVQERLDRIESDQRKSWNINPGVR